jgi:hypothetical protein
MPLVSGVSNKWQNAKSDNPRFTSFVILTPDTHMVERED